MMNTKDEMDFILYNYGHLIRDYLGQDDSELATSFFSESEEYVDKKERLDKGILSYKWYQGRTSNNPPNVTMTFYQDYSISSEILTDFTYCEIAGMKFVKIITPFTRERSYDLIIALRSEMDAILKELNVRQMASNFKADEFPIIGLDFTDLKKNTIDFLLNEDFRKFCVEHRIPLKRGVVLEGKPGTGKTMSLRWLKNKALENGIRFHSFSSPQEFLQNSEDFFEDGKKIFVFEDFDTALIDREKTGDTPNSILGRVLNVLEGVNQIHDTVSVFTTNKINVFDSAFLRPGRIDRVITYRLPGEGEVKMFFDAYIPDVSKEVRGRLEEYIKDVSADVSYAILKGICDDINIFIFENGSVSEDDAYSIAKEKMTGANKKTETKKASDLVL